jgi:AraC-like DNA-binding protein
MSTFAPRLSNEEKVDRVFQALSGDPRPKLSLRQLQEETGMSASQVKGGWHLLKRMLGTLAVVDLGRQNTVYHLSDEFTDGAQYLLWQARHIYTRICSERATLMQLTTISDSQFAKPLVETEGNLGGAWANLRQLIRDVAKHLGYTDTEITEILERPMKEVA